MDLLQKSFATRPNDSGIAPSRSGGNAPDDPQRHGLAPAFRALVATRQAPAAGASASGLIDPMTDPSDPYAVTFAVADAPGHQATQ